MKIAIIGAGFFGCSAALALSKKHKIDIFEKSDSILNGASLANQLRFHLGYHYPRSPETVNEIKKNYRNFLKYFGKNIFGKTKNLYGISSEGSKIKFEDYLGFLKKNKLKFKKIKREIKCIFHNGANSNTTCWDAKDIMEKNYIYSKNLLNFATKNKIDFIYASSASVYGNNGRVLIEDPLNLYAVSKLIFDNYVKDFISNNKKKNSKVIGLRYFNVYGPYEDHKTNMSSPVLSFVNQIKKKRQIKLFGSTKNVNFKKFTRDFIHIDDICNINYKFYSSKKKINGIYDVGSG
ncbi:FAD-dependent oxidoreductase, partial [Candidatus Pelagibacter sp.]|nr:FAD-dependent oxidoreductase [Candidatus Pelagibacter sp.]